MNLVPNLGYGRCGERGWNGVDGRRPLVDGHPDATSGRHRSRRPATRRALQLPNSSSSRTRDGRGGCSRRQRLRDGGLLRERVPAASVAAPFEDRPAQNAAARSTSSTSTDSSYPWPARACRPAPHERRECRTLPSRNADRSPRGKARPEASGRAPDGRLRAPLWTNGSSVAVAAPSSSSSHVSVGGCSASHASLPVTASTHAPTHDCRSRVVSPGTPPATPSMTHRVGTTPVNSPPLIVAMLNAWATGSRSYSGCGRVRSSSAWCSTSALMYFAAFRMALTPLNAAPACASTPVTSRRNTAATREAGHTASAVGSPTTAASAVQPASSAASVPGPPISSSPTETRITLSG